MDELKRELDALVARLIAGDAEVDATAAQVLPYLKTLQSAMERCRSPLGLVPTVNALRQFWMTSVPWCSGLSRDIEKIIIIHEELVEAAAISFSPDA